MFGIINKRRYDQDRHGKNKYARHQREKRCFKITFFAEARAENKNTRNDPDVNELKWHRHRVLRVARTLADLDGSENINKVHISEAVSFRQKRQVR